MNDYIKINIKENNKMPAFGATVADEENNVIFGDEVEMFINMEAFIRLVENREIEKSEVPYFIAETIFHVLESHFKTEFDCERIEKTIEKIRGKDTLKLSDEQFEFLEKFCEENNDHFSEQIELNLAIYSRTYSDNLKKFAEQELLHAWKTITDLFERKVTKEIIEQEIVEWEQVGEYE